MKVGAIVTPGADKVLFDKGIFDIPDILANAGGVTVSYFEWVQDQYGFFWSDQEVNCYLEKTMAKAFHEAYDKAKQYKVHLRMVRIAWRSIALTRPESAASFRSPLAVARDS